MHYELSRKKSFIVQLDSYRSQGGCTIVKLVLSISCNDQVSTIHLPQYNDFWSSPLIRQFSGQFTNLRVPLIKSFSGRPSSKLHRSPTKPQLHSTSQDSRLRGRVSHLHGLKSDRHRDRILKDERSTMWESCSSVWYNHVEYDSHFSISRQRVDSLSPLLVPSARTTHCSGRNGG